MKLIFLKLIAAFLLLGSYTFSFAQQKECAMVLIHGKWGNTQYISFFGRRIAAICDFKAIEMPWSQRRAYDKPYLVAIDEIANQVKEFKSQGYKRVVIAGHSFCANASLAYITQRDDIDAIIALAPGHNPRSMFKRGMNREVLEKGKDLVSSGIGNESITFEDFNQGVKRAMRIPANSFLSYFDPQGLGDMLSSAKSFKKSVPLMLVIGTRDPYFPYAKDEIFRNAPDNAENKYLVVDADHGSTPEMAISEVIEWLKKLP